MAMTLLKSITNLRYTSRISVLFCSINISVVPLRVSRYLWLCIGTILGLLIQQDVRSTKIMEKMRAFFFRYSVSLVCEIIRNLQAFSSILLFNDLNNGFVPPILLHSILTVFFWLVVGCACGRRFNNMLDSRTRLMRNA